MMSIWDKINRVVIYAITSAIVLASLVLAYINLAPVDVLKDWKLTVDNSEVYKPGDTITVVSSSKKVRNVSPSATRYIQCLKKGVYDKVKNNPGYTIQARDWDGYVILSNNNTPRPIGQNSTNIDIGIPSSIPNLPSYCRIYIYIKYEIYNFRSFIEYNYSNTFEVRALTADERTGLGLLPSEVIVQQNPNIVNTQPNYTYSPQFVENSPVNNGVVFPTPEVDNPDPQVNQNILQRTVDGTLNAVGGLLNGITKLVP